MMICKILKMLAVTALLPEMATYAQTDMDRNRHFSVSAGEFNFPAAQEKKKENVGTVLTELASAALTGKVSKQLPQYTEAVKSAVMSGIGNAIRLDAVETGAATYIDFIATATISNISTTHKVEPSSTKGKPDQDYYRALISVTVNLSDAATGNVVDSRNFSIRESDLGWMSSQERTMDDALSVLRHAVRKYYDSCFPLSASIIERGDINKDKQKNVYIDLGSADSVTEGMQFDVYSVKMIAGREAKTLIGRVKIDKVMGDDISLCKVNKGDKQVKAALDNNEVLALVSHH